MIYLIQAFRDKALNPENPVERGTAQTPTSTSREEKLSNKFYNAVPEIVENYMSEITKITSREYHLFDYYGAEDATDIIVAMGSVTETTKEVIDYLMAQGKKVGLVAVHLYRPFSTAHLMKAFPATTKRIAVLDRTKEPGRWANLFTSISATLLAKPSKLVKLRSNNGRLLLVAVTV